MRDLNKVELLGSVSKEVRINQSAKGLSIANIPVSTVQKRANGMEINTYHTVVCFGELADMASTFKVGDRVFASGNIQNESYEKDGQKVYVTKVKASHLARLSAEALDTPAGSQSAPKGGDAPANFPHGETNKSVGFPFYDEQRSIKWEQPAKDGSQCSPTVEKNGLVLTCRWEDEEDPSRGGTVFGMKQGETEWSVHGQIPGVDNDIPF